MNNHAANDYRLFIENPETFLNLPLPIETPFHVRPAQGGPMQSYLEIRGGVTIMAVEDGTIYLKSLIG